YLGGALDRKGDLDGAIAVYREAARRNPGHVNTHLNLGSDLYARGDLRGAIAVFQKAVELDPNSPAASLLGMARQAIGHKLRAEGDFDGAIAAFRELMALDPKLAHIARLNLDLTLQEKAERDAMEGRVAPPPREVKLGNPQR